MDTTYTLLSRALAIKPAAAWARELNVDPSAIAQAKKRGRLSPTLAGVMASELGEDYEHWTCVAALEAEPASPLLERLMKTATKIRKL